MHATVSAAHEDGHFQGERGLRIEWQAWMPAAVPAATVVLAHGASEHSGRYAWTAERLADAGYATYAIDHRGHGRSEGPRAVIDRMDNAVADLHQLVGLAASRAGRRPYLLGHSMGGAVALAYALRHQVDLEGLILSAPLAALEAASPITRVMSAVLSTVAPSLGVFEIDSTAVSRDPEVVRAYDEDPLNHHGKLPARTIAELSATVGRFEAEVPTLTLPLLTMHGSADRLTPPEGSEMVHERAGSADKSILRYEGLYHELLNEPERDRVAADIVAWLDTRAKS
ncbi:MAG: acylglycerol lipase [Thermoleophilaceae bacterium]|jgi:alpha-beta hydrolase superfamily lysophospholipase|nr:acylglycerol lipase [Thermoleophilaceae bacterium]